MKRFLALSALLALCVAGIVGCGGGGKSGTSFSTSGQAGAVFVTGEDAPLPSVLSRRIAANVRDQLKGAAASRAAPRIVVE